MKISEIYKKLFYFTTCIIFAVLLTGCKESEDISTAFDGLSESSFLAEAKASLANKKPIAIAFTAEWCPHCKQYKPVFQEVKESLKDQATFINIDVDDAQGSVISDRFQVKGIPTTAFVRGDGSVFKVEVGELDKEKLSSIISDLVASKKRGKDEPVAPFPIELKKETPKKEEVEKNVKEKVVPVEAGKVEPEKVEEPKAAEPQVEEVIPEPAKEAIPAPVEQVEEEKDLPPQELIKENDVPGDVPTLEFPTR